MSNKYNFIQDIFHGVNISELKFHCQSEKNLKREKIQHFSYGYQWIHYVEWYMNSNYLLTKYQNLNLN